MRIHFTSPLTLKHSYHMGSVKNLHHIKAALRIGNFEVSSSQIVSRPQLDRASKNRSTKRVCRGIYQGAVSEEKV